LLESSGRFGAILRSTHLCLVIHAKKRQGCGQILGMYTCRTRETLGDRVNEDKQHDNVVTKKRD
jgi:hypothetical protein